MKNSKNNLTRNQIKRERWAKRLYILAACFLLGYGILQAGLSFQSHDPSQRPNGIPTIAGGIIIAFTKEILTFITG